MLTGSATSVLSFLTPPLQDSLFLRPVTLDEIVNVINGLKITSANVNEISVKVIKLAKYHIAEPISYLINSSFTAVCFLIFLRNLVFH